MTGSRAAHAVEADLTRNWHGGGLGLEETEWRVTPNGIEHGAMASVLDADVTATDSSSQNTAQFLSIGGGEGGFQIEYRLRGAYGINVLSFGRSALVLRGGLDLELMGMPHYGSFQFGPLLDFGYQTITQSGFLDVSVQAVIPIFPAVYSEHSSQKAAEWVSLGPHLSAGLKTLYFDGNVARTMYEGELRTEFHMNLCGATGFILCARLHNYRYDDAKKPVTFLGFLVGIGDFGP